MEATVSLFLQWHASAGLLHRLVMRALLDHDGTCCVKQLCLATSLDERAVKFVLVELESLGFVSCDLLMRRHLCKGVAAAFVPSTR